MQSITHIQESKERQMILIEQRDTHKRLQIGAKEVRIREAGKEVEDLKRS